MTIPTYEEAEEAVDLGNPTPLEQFVYDYAPAPTFLTQEWFSDLQKVVTWLEETR